MNQLKSINQAELRHRWTEARALLGSAEGFLTDREAQWLYVTAARGSGRGVVVEIGSFKGRSTIALAKGTELRGGGEKVVAVDPHCTPAPTDPALRGVQSSEPEFRANLARAGVTSIVEVRVQYSTHAARDWSTPVRLLWLDGDHTVEGVRADFHCWTPHLSDGGILAMHDVLHGFAGPARVFLEGILESSGWTDIGFVKSIGFATKAEGTDLASMRRTRLQATLLRRMIKLSGSAKRSARMEYNLYRAFLHRV